MAYYVSYSDCTPEEPSSGWYYSKEDEDGNETIRGPFASKADALDDESDGAYSSWLESKREDNYERDMIDAGRGHLLKSLDD
jgi:hypothetical protein